MVMASCVAVLFGDKIRSQSKPFYIYFNWLLLMESRYPSTRSFAEQCHINQQGAVNGERMGKKKTNPHQQDNVFITKTRSALTDLAPLSAHTSGKRERVTNQCPIKWMGAG